MRPRQLLNRRQAVCALLAAAAPLRFARAEDMVEFVRALYVRQVKMRTDDERMSEEAFYALFSSELRALMQAPRPGLAREPIGRILNAFFGWGVLPHQPVVLNDVMPAYGGTGGLYLVRVDLMVRGEPRQIVVRPVRENGLWKIADISYQNGESLLDYYRRITRP
jgi:hypothetical protein